MLRGKAIASIVMTGPALHVENDVRGGLGAADAYLAASSRVVQAAGGVDDVAEEQGALQVWPRPVRVAAHERAAPFRAHGPTSA